MNLGKFQKNQLAFLNRAGRCSRLGSRLFHSSTFLQCRILCGLNGLLGIRGLSVTSGHFVSFGRLGLVRGRLFDFGAGVLPLFRHKLIDFVKGHNHIAGLRYGRPGLFLLGFRCCGLFGCGDRLGGLRGSILRRACVQFFIGHLRSSFPSIHAKKPPVFHAGRLFA